jgi:zinc transport system permease protein
MIGGLTVIILGIVWWRYADFFLLSFDEEIAKASGRPVMRDSMLLAMMTAATVAVSLRVVGVLLIGALMVIPVLAAMAWGKGFRTTMGIAIALSVFSVMTGLAVSYRFDTATGGTIVLCSLVLFVMSVVLRRVTIQ